jgi:RHS repeat-associated protein
MGSVYTYDGMGERVEKAGSKIYWKGVGSTALMETNTSDQSPTMYIFFNGARIARVDPGAAAKYSVTDNVGSTEVETDSLGNLLNESLFFPYGAERIVQQNDTANNYRFTGKERDQETGLDDFGARYYDSVVGRFMTPDWDAKPTSVPYASFGDPQTLNLYSYVENGPLNRVDADGHATDNPPATITQQPQCVDSEVESCSSGGPSQQAVLASNDSQAQQPASSTGNNMTQPAQDQSKQAQQQNDAEVAQNNTPPAPAQNGQQPAQQSSTQYSGGASYYNLPGQKTASGAKFDPNGMNAAMTSEKAKLGQTVTVTYTTKGKDGKTTTTTISVVVNDRGPFKVDSNGRAVHPLAPHPDRVIDLTPAAFTKLAGSRNAGVVQVTVTVPNE